MFKFFLLELIAFNTNSDTGACGGVEKEYENKAGLWECFFRVQSFCWQPRSLLILGECVNLSESMAFIWILS